MLGDGQSQPSATRPAWRRCGRAWHDGFLALRSGSLGGACAGAVGFVEALKNAREIIFADANSGIAYLYDDRLLWHAMLPAPARLAASNKGCGALLFCPGASASTLSVVKGLRRDRDGAARVGILQCVVDQVDEHLAD